MQQRNAARYERLRRFVTGGRKVNRPKPRNRVLVPRVIFLRNRADGDQKKQCESHGSPPLHTF
jgi:hypothetical protein